MRKNGEFRESFDTWVICKVNILISFVPAPERGLTPCILLRSDVAKDRGFVKTKKLIRTKYAFI